jgi:hypothetical protein
VAKFSIVSCFVFLLLLVHFLFPSSRYLIKLCCRGFPDNVSPKKLINIFYVVSSKSQKAHFCYLANYTYVDYLLLEPHL